MGAEGHILRDRPCGPVGDDSAGACGCPSSSPPPTPPSQDLPKQDACPTRLGADPTEVTARALLTLAEVREDMVRPELGSGCTHLGVAVAEAAGAASRPVGLQVKSPRATSEKEAGQGHRPNERGAQLD